MEYINFQKNVNLYVNFKYYLKLIIIIFILFYVSLLSVNTLRDKYFFKGNSLKFFRTKNNFNDK